MGRRVRRCSARQRPRRCGQAGVGDRAGVVRSADRDAGAACRPTDLFDFLLVPLGQVALGLLLGWVTGLALAIFQSAGAVIDLTSGFSVSALLDPATGAQTAVMARRVRLGLHRRCSSRPTRISSWSVGSCASFEAVAGDRVADLRHRLGGDGRHVAVGPDARRRSRSPRRLLGALLLAEVAFAVHGPVRAAGEHLHDRPAAEARDGLVLLGLHAGVRSRSTPRRSSTASSLWGGAA